MRRASYWARSHVLNQSHKELSTANSCYWCANTWISNSNTKGIKAEIEQGLNSRQQQCERHSVLMKGKCVKMDQDGEKKKCQLTEDIMHEPKLHLWDVINPIESNEARMTQGAWISHGWLSSIYQQPHGDFVTTPELFAHPFISLMGLCNVSPQWPLL